MAFLSPLFLLGALAAAIPIVLHLLKREPEARVRFAAVKLLKHAPVEDTERRHLRELLLLALRVMALILLAGAFARPYFMGNATAESGGITIVALDTSLSLSAPGQFARAQALAKQTIDRAASSDLTGLVTFDNTAHAVVPPTMDRALVVAGVGAARPGFGSTAYRAALSAASAMLASHRGRQATIVLVTDLQASGWEAGEHAAVPESARVEVADVGRPPANLALTSVRRVGDRVVASVRNTADRGRDVRVRLSVDGKAVSEGTVSVGPNQTADATLAGARGSAAIVAIDDPDGIQGDNTRYLALGNAGRPAVLVVTTSGAPASDAFYVQQALIAGAGNDAAFQVDGGSPSQLSSGDASSLDRYAAVLLLSTRGLEPRGRDKLDAFLRKGGGLLVGAGPDLDGEVVGQTLEGLASLAAVADKGRTEPRTLAPADARHPVFQAFGVRASALALVSFNEIAAISGRDCQGLARFTSGETALLDCAMGDGRVLVFASDLNARWNDFPLHATFVPFLHEAVRYLAGGHAQTGDYLAGATPAGVPPTPGIARVGAGGTGAGSERLVSVNVDPSESEPERISPDEFQAAVTRLKDVGRSEERVEARQQESRQHVWQYILALMVGMLLLESVVAKRTA